MDNSFFREEVNYWDEYFRNNLTADNRLFELAFFKIFVKFELFVSEIFVHYCIGNQSVNLFSPARKLNFIDRNHFDNIIKNVNSNYIDYFEKMYHLSPHIFHDEDSPFVIFSAASHVQNINQMRVLRNFIAHESQSSKTRYSNTLLNGRYIEPYEYLLKRKKNSTITNYTYYINSMVEISNYILGPVPNNHEIPDQIILPQ